MTVKSGYAEPCGRTPAKDSPYCARHSTSGNVRRLYRLKTSHAARSELTKVYRSVLSPALRQVIDDQLNGRMPAEQLQLYEELALMRHAATQAVVLYDAAVQLVNSKDKGDAQAAATLMSATELMKAALKDVADLAKAAAQIDNMAQDKLSVQQLAVVVDQMVRVASDVFTAHGVADEVVEQFAGEVKDRVKIPMLETRGTLITPDEDVIAMDATVPSGPDEVDEEGDGRYNGNGKT